MIHMMSLQVFLNAHLFAQLHFSISMKVYIVQLCVWQHRAAVPGWQHPMPTASCLHLQAISDWRAKLSQRYDPTNTLQNDDQNILKANNVTPILVPSNGYTFDRIPSQVRHRILDQGVWVPSRPGGHGTGCSELAPSMVARIWPSNISMCCWPICCLHVPHLLLANMPLTRPSFAAVPQTDAIFSGNITGSKGLFFPNGFKGAVKGVPVTPGNYPANVGVRASTTSSMTTREAPLRSADLLDALSSDLCCIVDASHARCAFYFVKSPGRFATWC